MKRMRLFKTSTALMAVTLLIFMFTSCSSDDNVVAENEKIEVTGEQFTFTIEDFDAEENLTRATSIANTKPEVIDLGDGLLAEVSIQPDPKTPLTRATKPISDGHYTIYAINTATNTRVTGADSKVSGTVSGGTFTKDAGTRLKLSPGTYTFVCYNDALTEVGTTSLSLGANNEDALIGVATETISGPMWHVNFTMKHQKARIRFNIVSYTNEGTGITAHLSSNANYTIHRMYTTNPFVFTNDAFAQVSATEIFPTSDTVVNSDMVKTYNNATDYNYLFPDIPVNDMKLDFTAGTIYGKSLAGKSIALTQATSTLAANHSYTINIKLKTLPYYLFEDGTVGALGDKGSRTPIGIVIDEKTTTDKGLAIALTDDGVRYRLGQGYYFYWIDGDDGTTNNMQGYELTWTNNFWSAGAPSSLLNQVPAEVTNMDSYYAAGHYTPLAPVTGSNVGKWFLPSAGYWKKALVKLGDLNESAMPSVFDGTADTGGNIGHGGTPVPWNSSKMTAYFTQAGGTFHLNDNYSLSGSSAPPLYGSVVLRAMPDNVYWDHDMFVTLAKGYARPFVFF